MATSEAPRTASAPVAPVAPPREDLPFRFWAWLERVLSHPRAGRRVLVLTLLAITPSLFSGLGADDHIHRLSLSGTSSIRGFTSDPLDLFRFAGPEQNRVLMEQGVFPWWADPQALLAFFRPITSLSHWLDHALWPQSAVLAHAQSALWFLLGLVGIWALYRRLLTPPWVAALALVFYGLDDARAGPLTWIANRNALVACGLSVWALVFHHLWRREQLRVGAWLSPLSLALGLLAGEGAIAIVAYLFAYALFLDDGPVVRRMLRLWPYLVVIVIWRLCARSLGYGSFGSGVYMDPLGEPLPFAVSLVQRLPILLLGQLAGPWSEVWNASSMVFAPLEWILWGLAAFVVGATAWLLRPIWRRDPVARFWALGAVLSVVPAAATFPSDRLLSWVAIGASAAMAQLLAALVAALRDSQSSIWGRNPALLGALGITTFHVILGPVTLPWRSTGISAVREMLERADGSVPKSQNISALTFVYVNPPADPFASYIPIMRADAGEPRPAMQRWLATGASDVVVERLDDRTLRVSPVGGFLQSPSEKMLRSPRRPLRVGEQVHLTGMTARIISQTPDGRPAEAQVRFDLPLEHPSLRWFQWVHDGYVPFDLPRIGQTVTLGKVDFFEVAYGAKK